MSKKQYYLWHVLISCASDCVSARTVLWYVTFFGFAINYLIRINLNLAIVAMVAPRSSKTGQLQSECLVFANFSDNSSFASAANSSKNFKTSSSSTGFPWDEQEQGMVLGSFFWMHWATQLPGGMLAQRYGGKSVFGLCQLVGITACFFIPASAYCSIYLLIFLRFIQGIAMGFCWPAMHQITGKWIPPNERSNFVTAYLGSSVGTAVMYPMCGLLVSWFSWESVFYVSGAMGVLWFAAWWTLVFDTPAQHPRISDDERKFIQKSLGQTVQHEKLKTPWKAMLTSLPLWMNIIAQWGGIWGLLTTLTQSPTYFKFIHGWNTKAVGFLSGLPHVVRMLFAWLFSILGDYLLTSEKMSRTNVRKLATAVCIVGQGVMTLLLAFVGCNSTAAIVLISAATGANGAVSTGPLASIVDLAPNFAGVSLGIVGMISAMPAFISPAIIGALTLNNQTVRQWQFVWLISAGMQIVPGVLYVIFAESEVQLWNSPATKAITPEQVELLTSAKSKLDNDVLTDTTIDEKVETKDFTDTVENKNEIII